MKLVASRVSLLGLVVALVGLSPNGVCAQDRVWTNLGPAEGSNVTGIALDPNDPEIFYATSDAGEAGTTGLRKSLDGGHTWIELGAGDPALLSLTCLAVDPSDSSTIYVGSAQGVVAASRDGGATWSKTPIGENPVGSIAVEPASDSVYAATRPAGFWGFLKFDAPVLRSNDAGRTWLETSLAKPRGAYALLADALHQSVLVGTDFAYPTGYYGHPTPSGGGVATSRDAGATWALPSADVGFSVTALTADPQGGHMLAATSSGQILRSEDAGATWMPRGKLPGTVTAIVVDPASSSTIYGSLQYGGVWRSADSGRTWRLFDAGLINDSVRSLVIDPTGRDLFAGTRAGVFHRELPPSSVSPCLAGDDHLCLLGSRFRVDLFAIDPRTQAPAPVKALAKGDRFGYFSFPTLTGDATLPEVFVKMLDATALPGEGHWFFSAALTNVAYELAVTDTSNGRIQLYDGQAFCGTADASAFPAQALSSAPARITSAHSSFQAAGVELALLSGRFRLTLAATDPRTGNAVAGVAIPQDDRFGYFSLPGLTGDSTLPEVFVKMLDATSLADQDFWLFQGGLTSLPYELTITDSATGASKTYRNDPIDPTRLCGSADLRVTTGPVPTLLTGVWTGAHGTAASATVAQFGDRLSFLATSTTPPGYATYSFSGTLSAGTVTGTFREEAEGCHFEGAASGLATASQIQVTAETLSGTCGMFYSTQFNLTPAVESKSH